MITIGIKGRADSAVDSGNTALAVGSGDLNVFATPAMCALMEKAASQSVAEFLEEGQSTVGTMLNINHTSATPVGMKVRCESELIRMENRRLVFSVRAYDACGEIGEGIHERIIIDAGRFMSKTDAKINK